MNPEVTLKSRVSARSGLAAIVRKCAVASHLPSKMPQLIYSKVIMRSCRDLFNALAVSLLFAVPICHGAAAENPAREARTARIIKSQLGAAVRAENLPGAESTLQFLRQTNPNLSQMQWSEIMDEVSNTMTSAMSQPGNPMFLAYKKLLSPFSDDDLAKLENLLNDPVYRKYSTTLTSPTAQQALMQGMIENSPWMPEALNLALRKRGLKEVH